MQMTFFEIYFEMFYFNFSYLCHNRNNLNRYLISSWQDLKQVHHKLPQGQERPDGSEGQDEESEDAEEEAIHNERPNKDEGDGALYSSVFAIARSATGMGKRGNGHSSVTSDQEDERGVCRTARSWELRKEICKSRGSRDVVFTTLHFLPRPEGEQCRPAASIFPRLVTGQQAHSKVLAETRKVSVDMVITTNRSKWSNLLLSYSSILSLITIIVEHIFCREWMENNIKHVLALNLYIVWMSMT